MSGTSAGYTIDDTPRAFRNLTDGVLVAVNALAGGSSANSFSKVIQNLEDFDVAVTIRMMALWNGTRTAVGNKNIDLGGRLEVTTGAFTSGQSIHSFRFHDVMPDPGAGQGVTAQGWVQGTIILPAASPSVTVRAYCITADSPVSMNMATAPNGFQAFGVDMSIEPSRDQALYNVTGT